jgi:hypothetical protein
MAFVIQYYRAGTFVAGSTTPGPLSHVAQVATRGLNRVGADSVKVYDPERVEVVWSKERPGGLSLIQ